MKDSEAGIVVSDALELARQRLQSAPNYEIFISIVRQLEALQQIVSEKPRDLKMLRSINVGHYGVREFAESDPAFSEKLVNAQWIASQLGQGLRP